MKFQNRTMRSVRIFAAALVAVMGLSSLLFGQQAPTPQRGLIDDWTHHHLVFSNPGSFTDAVAKGTVEKWNRITSDPRYQLQQLKRSNTQRALAAAPDFAARMAIVKAANVHPAATMPTPLKTDPVKKDWSKGMATCCGYATTLITNTTGGTITFTTTKSGYTLSPSAGTLSASAVGSVEFTGTPSAGDNLLVGSSFGYEFHSGPMASNCNLAITTTVQVCIVRNGTATQEAANLEAAINNNTSECGYIYPGDGSCFLFKVGSPSANTSASAGLPPVMQPNVYPAFYSYSPVNASCSDFVAFPTGQAGGASAANIIAYTNVYGTSGPDGTGCGAGAGGGAVPQVSWAYNTGTGYAVTTSPIVSGDGTKLAFVQSNGTSAELVVVKWAAGGSLASPAAIASSANITSCTAPCMTVTSLSHNASYSSPFYDFLGDDAAYEGDDSGDLEQFTGVFNGAISGPTTISLGSAPVASPVYDSTSGCVFAGDTMGYLYKVNSGSAPGGVCTSGTFGLNEKSELLGDGSANEGIFDAPLVDTTAGEVYVFVADSAYIGNCATGNNCVAEFATGFASGAAPGYEEPVGTGGAGYNLYSGAFDNVWFNSANSTGNLYVVGNTATSGGGTLYRLTLTSGLIAGVASAVTSLNSGVYPWPSPVTEFCNGTCTANSTETTAGTDYLFFSINGGKPSGCTGSAGDGCVLSYDINTTTPSLSGSGLNVTTPGTNGCWATGGIVVDNSATNLTGAQQIYIVNFNGAATGALSSCTPGSATINAAQASQASP